MKSDSEEENEGDDHIDGEQESPKISFKAEAAEAMDAAERPDNYPTPRSENGVGPVRPESCGSSKKTDRQIWEMARDI